MIDKILRGGGPVAWMTQNPVAANLAMAVLVIGGVFAASQVKQEVFPEFDLDMISIGVPYPGASPSEVEQGIVLAIEEAVRTIDGVKRVTASAVENAAGITVELELGTNANKALADVKSAVDRITSFPAEAERPVVSLLTNRQGVISLVIYGDQNDEVMRQLAERAREELLLDPDVTYVELAGVRPREISIEVTQANLRRYRLTLDDVARQVTRTAVELPGGAVKTRGGEVLVRTAERRDLGAEFRDIPIITSIDGSEVRLGELAHIVDGFAETDESATFEGKPAVMVNVFRSGDQTPIEVADAVKAYAKRAVNNLPPGVELGALNDRSEMYRDRIDLLLRNARLGLLLVMIVLGLFLNLRLAFWVTMGIPISFAGSLLLMPALNVSINMVSLFAFIITLGIVVDDAIVVGENIFEERQRGAKRMAAAIKGAKDISVPVVFSVLTTVAAFLPLFFVPGSSGKIFRVIPTIVCCVLLISLIESVLILPAHLAHRGKLAQYFFTFFVEPFLSPERRAARALAREQEDEDTEKKSKLVYWLEAPQRKFSGWLERFIDKGYGPWLDRAARNRYLTLATGLAILLVTLGFAASGRIDFTPMPKVDSDAVTAKLTMPFGVAVHETQLARNRLEAAAREVLKENGGDAISEGVYTQTGAAVNTRGGASGGGAQATGSHLGGVQVFLVPSDQRPLSATDFARQWREKVRDLSGYESLVFAYTTGPGAGAALEIQLSHRDLDVLETAAAEVATSLGTFAGVRDIDDGFSAGKPQLDFKLKPEAKSAGLTSADLGRQVRSAFFGAEALRQQRGREEVRVMVRRPEAERDSESEVENLLVRTPDGGELPLSVAAEVVRGSSYTQIKRADGRRVVSVTADTVPGVANAEKILGSLGEDAMPQLLARYPGLGYSFEGERRSSNESLDALKDGYVFALIIIFALLAVPFRSYIQPVVVMSAIPFGIVGAVFGHVLMGYDLSLISLMGIVAVSGIVVNDSLVMVHAANALRDGGMSSEGAIQQAGRRRFRPIMLTSLTTFFGLAPMILEPSLQARFLIPMAISLGFGVLFSTFIILLLVPALYLIVEDLRDLVTGQTLDSARAAERARFRTPTDAPSA